MTLSTCGGESLWTVRLRAQSWGIRHPKDQVLFRLRSVGRGNPAGHRNVDPTLTVNQFVDDAWPRFLDLNGYVGLRR